MATENLDQFLNDESLIKVDISSTGEHTHFYLPVSLMVSREVEMREAAKHFQISQDRWTDSLLFREWRCVDDASRNPTQRGFLRNGEVVIRLNPEMDCAVSNHSHSLRWKPWLTTCIRAYYNTGTIRVPDACIGSDILLALEYFGIVYTPEQLVFDSFGGYLRVKLWSDYYTHRSQLAQWVVQRLLRSHAKHSHTFVTGPNPREVDIFLGSRKAEVLDGELHLDPTKYGGNPSCSVVHDFFHDEDQDVAAGGGQQQASLDELMRDDFRIYLQNSLQGTQVEFRIQRLTCQGKVMPRATLHIDFLRKNSPMSLPSDEGRATAVQQPTSNQIKKSPSTASKSNSMFRRVGSLKKNRNKSIRSVPSSEHIYADLDKAAMHQSGRSAPNGNRKGLESLVPSDERGLGTTPKVGLPNSTPNDYEVDYGAPMTMIQLRDGDAVSVLTGDWREDDSVAQRSLGRTHKYGSVPHARSGELAQRYRSLLAASESVAGDRSEFMTPVDALSVTDQTVRRKEPLVQQEQVDAPRQKSVNRETTTKPVEVEETSPPDVTNPLCGVDLSLSAICSPIPRTPQRKERGTADANNSSNSNTSSTQTAKTEVETDEDEPTLISRVEGFLPDIDLRTLKTDTSVQHTETLDDLTAAWLRDAFTLSNYIYDDPIPNEKDEYLQLARQAGEVETPTTKSPTRVKDIIEELMDLDIRDVTGADNEDVAAVFNECAAELGTDSNLGKEVSLEVDSKSSRSKRTKTLPPALPKRKTQSSGQESSSGSDTVDDSDVTKRATNVKRNRGKQRSSKLSRLEEEKSQGKIQDRKRKGIFGLLRRKG